MPHIDVLLDEMLELKIVSDKKVDHPRKKSKDLSDAVCGSVYNAMTLTQRNENKMIEIHDFRSMKKRNREELEVQTHDPLFDGPDPNEHQDVWSKYLQGIGMM